MATISFYGGKIFRGISRIAFPIHVHICITQTNVIHTSFLLKLKMILSAVNSKVPALKRRILNQTSPIKVMYQNTNNVLNEREMINR